MKSIDELITKEEIAEAVRSLEDLIASEGWKLYIAMVQQQETARINLMLEPLGDSPNAILQQEFMKGEYQAYRSCSVWPPTMISTFTERLEELRSLETDDEKPT